MEGQGLGFGGDAQAVGGKENFGGEAGLTLTLALDRYDRHIPLFLNAVEGPAGLKYRALEVGMAPPRRDGIDRHGRMLRDLEFDAAEVSLASYIIARQRGIPLTAVPVFPRRLFSQNHVFVHRKSGIRAPADLAGRKVGLWAFQVTMSVLFKGDLKGYYGVPWEGIEWHTQYPEEMPWSHPSVKLHQAPPGMDLAQMLIEREIDAYVHPHPPHLMQQSPEVTRLFAEPELECARYAAARGYYPIMHLVAIKEERVRERPALPRELMTLLEEAKRVACDFYHDPGYALLAFSRNTYERQLASLGADPWTAGLKANRANLDTFIADMVDQRLLERAVPAASLFHASVLDT
jgi:4,5-dihydroxyphthalate decarboxylase